MTAATRLGRVGLALLAACEPEALPPIPPAPVAIAVPDGATLRIEPVRDGPQPRALPTELPAIGDLAALDVVVPEAVRIVGRVVGERITTFSSARLPSVDRPVPGEIRFRPLSGERATVRIADDGTYEAVLAPGTHEVSVVPDDPAIPAVIRVATWERDDRFDLRIEQGVPLWGRVVQVTEGDPQGNPLVDVSVTALDALGRTTSTAVTDDGGYYEFQVPRGDGLGIWSLRAGGGPGRPLPTLRTVPVLVPAATRVDLTYGEPRTATLSARVREAGGAAAARLDVRITSTAIDGYPDGTPSGTLPADASFSAAATTSSDGQLTVALPPGTYRLVTLPSTEDASAPLVVDALTVAAGFNGLDLTVPGRTVRRIGAADPAGDPLPGASIVCVERAGRRRVTTAAADEDGVGLITLADTVQDCVVGPPSARVDLASAAIVVAPDGLPTEVTLPAAVRVSGTVSLRTADGGVVALPHAVVRLLGPGGGQLAATTADATGAYTLRLAAP